MNNNILDPQQLLNLNPYDYLINQYYWNVINRNILRNIVDGNNDNLVNIMDNLGVNNINIVLNTVNMVINNIGDALNNHVNNLDNNQRQRLILINHLRDV